MHGRSDGAQPLVVAGLGLTMAHDRPQRELPRRWLAALLGLATLVWLAGCATVPDALRVNVRATSYGGEPDAACVAGIGDGDPDQRITIQETAVLCDAAASRIPQLV